MLRKLLKYDSRPIARVWGIIAVAILALSVVGSITLRFLITNAASADESWLMSLTYIIGVLLIVICFIGIFASPLATSVLVYLRFYKNFFTDEGYLTFTLPVSRKKLLLSKTINAFLWLTLNTVLIVICVLIFCLIAPPTYGEGLINTVVYKDVIGHGISGLWKSIGGWSIVYIIIFAIMAAAMQLFSINLIHFCITVASVTAKKLKLLLAFGIYYAINSVMSFAFQIFGVFGILMMGEGFIILLEEATQNMVCLTVALILLIACAMISAFAGTMYFATLGNLERKFNLA